MSDKFSKAFFVSIRKGDLVAVKRALMEGADPNGRDENDLAPLMWSARKGHFPVFLELLKAGADLKLVDATKRTFLHHCIGFKKHNFLSQALDISGIPLDATDMHGFTALDVAIADFKNERCVELLRAAGAKPNLYK